MNDTQDLLAWEVDISSMRCIVFAATKAKANWLAVKSFWSAGYGRKGVWPRPAAKRQPVYDKSHLKSNPSQHAWVPEYVRETI
jgi:hypothetical protein